METYIWLSLLNLLVVGFFLSWFFFYFMSMISAIMEFNDTLLIMVQKQQGIDNPTEHHGKTLYDYFNELKTEEE
jgi:hypothetical protein